MVDSSCGGGPVLAGGSGGKVELDWACVFVFFGFVWSFVAAGWGQARGWQLLVKNRFFLHVAGNEVCRPWL